MIRAMLTRLQGSRLSWDLADCGSIKKCNPRQGRGPPFCKQHRHVSFDTDPGNWAYMCPPTTELRVGWYYSLLHYLILLKILFIFREGGRERGKHQCVVASHAPPVGDLFCNPGMCPDWESNW